MIGETPAVSRVGTPTEPLAKPLKRDDKPDRFVIEVNAASAVGMSEALEVIARLLRKNGRIVILDE
jgi:hypothetical protein